MNRFVKRHYHFISFFLLGVIFVAWVMLQNYIYPETTEDPFANIGTEISDISLSSSGEITSPETGTQSDNAKSQNTEPVALSAEKDPVSATTDNSVSGDGDPVKTYNEIDVKAGTIGNDVETESDPADISDTPESVEEIIEPEEEVILEEGSYGSGEGKMPFDICLANVRESLNVRSGSGEDYEVIAKFLPVDYAHVLEKGSEWSLITSGEITGYAHNDYLITGDKAIKKLVNSDKLFVTVTEGPINIRAEKSTEAKVLRHAKAGETFKCIPSESDSNWFAIKYDDGNAAYIATAFATVTVDMDTIDSLTPVG